MRLYTVQPPLEWLDSVSVSGHYQTPAGAGPATTLDLSAERNLLTFGVQYSRPNNTFQATGRRSVDVLAGRTDTSATVVYTFVPQVAAEGLAFTFASVLYTLSSSQTPIFGYSSHTVGAVFGVRLNREFSVSTSATATAVQLSTLGGLLWSGTVSSALTYAQDGTNAYLVPGFSLQGGAASWNVVGGGSTKLSRDLTATGTVFWSANTLPSASAALTYIQGPWQYSGTVSSSAGTSGPNLSFGVGARVALPDQLSLGASVSVVPATWTPLFAADVSKQLGGVVVGGGFTLSAPASTASTFTAQVSVSGQQKPWQGNLYASYTRAADHGYGSASGTLTYDAAPFGAQLGLGLNLGEGTGGVPALTGRGDLTLNYAVSPALDISASARYERSVATTAEASFRYGLGLRYRFPDKESP
ncbi:hypothetical protein [Deinococcus altitudinis]|uniref:hypothetical protein n=1 Tax=Deinococcus altitudinis TaxID=468914 RepID=UPI00389151DB